METVTIKDVKKNERDWYEITLEGDDRVLATKDEDLVKAATAAIGGSPVAVEVNTRVKGTYTNHYIVSVDGVKEKSRPRVSGSGPALTRSASPRTSGGGRDPETQERIARQWAYGRAIELLMASEQEFSFPLDQFQFEALKTQADALLEATK